MAAAEARAAGYGGIAAVARATGIARSTIGRGLADLDQPALPPGQVRRINVRDQEMACLNIQGDEFHPEWNYTIAPRAPQHPTCSP